MVGVTHVGNSGSNIYYLGDSAGTYDVSSIPNYANFTEENFIVCGGNSTTTLYDSANSQTRTATTTVSKTYNASTGKLKVTNGTASCNVSNTVLQKGSCKVTSAVGDIYLVTDISKIKSI